MKLTKKDMAETMLLWDWEHTPEAVKKHISCPDDISYVAFVPNTYKSEYFYLFHSSSFGCFEVVEEPVDGGKLFIGYHG